MWSYQLSPDGAWFWDGRRWLPTRVVPAPLPSFLGRRRGSHWEDGELVARSIGWPFAVAAAIWSFQLVLQVSELVWNLNEATRLPGAMPGFMVWLLVATPLLFVTLGGCSLYYLCLAVRPPSLRVAARGIVARQPWRGSFYIPWDAVIQVGTYRGMRLQLVVEVSEDFWSYTGRRWTPRWAAWAGPPRCAGMIMVPPLGTGMEMADVVRCVREIAPAHIPVADGLRQPR